MDSLLFRFVKGDVSPSEEDMVLTWRRAAVANETYFQELVRLLALTADAEPGSLPLGMPRPSAAQLTATGEAQPTRLIPPPRLPSPPRLIPGWLTGLLASVPHEAAPERAVPAGHVLTYWWDLKPNFGDTIGPCGGDPG